MIARICEIANDGIESLKDGGVIASSNLPRTVQRAPSERVVESDAAPIHLGATSRVTRIQSRPINVSKA